MVRKDSLNEGDKVIYFPPEIEFPTYVAKGLQLEQYLRKGRIVKAVRLRGQLSYGVALPVAEFEGLDNTLPNDIDVSYYFGTKRYEQKAIVEGHPGFRARQTNEHALLNRYTDIERYERFRMAIPHGTKVYVTEKIHGSNVRISVINKELIVGSRKSQWAIPATEEDALRNWFWHPVVAVPGVRELVTALGEQYNQVILFGETYGAGVQGKFTYGEKGLAFRAFDIMLNGVYQNFETFLRLANQYGIPTVPIDSIEPFDENLARIWASAPSNITDAHIREGVVIRPESEDHVTGLGRVILKLINPEYDVKKSEGKIEDLTVD